MNWKAAAIFVFGQKNVKKTLAAALPLLVLTTTAETIRFDDIDRGPADVLHVGGITIGNGQVRTLGSPSTPALVATGAGIGLGVDNATIDRIYHFPDGAATPDSTTTESLSISLDDPRESINSITIRASIEGGASLTFVEVLTSLHSTSPLGFPYFSEFLSRQDNVSPGLAILQRRNPNDPSQAFFDHNVVDIEVVDADGNDQGIPGYRGQNGKPDATYKLSISILSIDFSRVPSLPDTGSTASLLGAAVCAVGVLMRRSR